MDELCDPDTTALFSEEDVECTAGEEGEGEGSGSSLDGGTLSWRTDNSGEEEEETESAAAAAHWRCRTRWWCRERPVAVVASVLLRGWVKDEAIAVVKLAIPVVL